LTPPRTPTKDITFPYNVNDDKELIKWFQKKYLEIEFITYEPEIDNYARSKKLQEDIKNLKVKSLHEQKKELLEIWKNLLGNAIVYLKSQDKREKFNDDEDYGVDKLYDFFKSFSNFESLFYGANEYYRDHVSHMFKVFLLGEMLIKETINFDSIDVGENILKKVKTERPISNGEKEAMWCIISLTHDLGYGIGVIPEINKKTREMLHQFGNFNPRDLSYTFPSQPLYNYIIQFISSKIEKRKKTQFINHVQSKYYLKFSGSLEKTNHGIISCIVLMRNLVYFLESDYTLDQNKPLTSEDARHFLIRRTILRSIASHDCEDIYYLKVPDFPFLLTLFDEMQEWCRPKLSDLFEKTPDMSLTVNSFNNKKIDYRITIKYSNKLEPQQIEKEHKNAIKYFKRKCEKIRRILRSAVDGKDRNFTLHFTLMDEIESSARIYEITHVKPNNVKYKNGKNVCSWQEIENLAKGS
jgi:hypothetical protein